MSGGCFDAKKLAKLAIQLKRHGYTKTANSVACVPVPNAILRPLESFAELRQRLRRSGVARLQ